MSSTRLLQSLFAAAALAGFAAAQCAAVSGSTLAGNAQNGTMFNVVNVSAAPLTITAFEQATNSGPTGTFEIYTKAGTWSGFEATPTAWTLVGSASLTGLVPGSLVELPIAVNVTLAPGATQGFYITYNAAANSVLYTTGVNQIGAVIGSDANIQITGGPGKVYPFAASFGLPTAGRLWNGRVIYTTGGACTKAATTTLGQGCGGVFNSFYQSFADAAVASAALQGNALQLIATPTGYAGVWLPGAAGALFVTPVAPTVQATDDDGEVTVTPSVPLPTPYGPQANLRVTGNGVIGFGAAAQTFPGGNSFTPTAAPFLNSNQGGFYSWHDYNEIEGGDVQTEEIGGILYVTYNAVESYPAAPTVNPSTLQFQLDLGTGNCTIVWVQVDADITSTFGSAHLVGVTAPGFSGDPQSVNLATAPSLLTINPETLPPTLTATNRPVQAVAAAQNWNLDANNLPVGLGVDIIGLADPGITDLSLFGLGQPGCQLRATLDVTGAFLAGGLHSWSIPIPAGAPALSGVQLFTQTAVLDFAVTLSQTRTTNGVSGTIGNY